MVKSLPFRSHAPLIFMTCATSLLLSACGWGGKNVAEENFNPISRISVEELTSTQLRETPNVAAAPVRVLPKTIEVEPIKNASEDMAGNQVDRLQDALPLVDKASFEAAEMVARPIADADQDSLTETSLQTLSAAATPLNLIENVDPLAEATNAGAALATNYVKTSTGLMVPVSDDASYLAASRTADQYCGQLGKKPSAPRQGFTNAGQLSLAYNCQ